MIIFVLFKTFPNITTLSRIDPSKPSDNPKSLHSVKFTPIILQSRNLTPFRVVFLNLVKIISHFSNKHEEYFIFSNIRLSNLQDLKLQFSKTIFELFRSAKSMPENLVFSL